MLLMAGALVRCQTIGMKDLKLGTFRINQDQQLLREDLRRLYKERDEAFQQVYGWPWPMVKTFNQWQIRPAIYNAVACSVLVFCTGFVVERWRRNRWQLRVASLFQLTAIVAILLGLRAYVEFGPIPWWLCLPVLIGLACTLSAIGWAIADSIPGLRPRQP